MVAAILLQLFLILLNAVFSAAEIAVISMNDLKLENMAASGDKRASRIVKLTSNPAKFLATIQVAITLSGFLGSAYAADNFAEPLVKVIQNSSLHMNEENLKSICVFVITLIISYFSIVFGELVPKRIAMEKMEGVAFGTSGLLSVVSVLFKPLVWLLTASTNTILGILHISTEDNEQVTEEEIRMMLANSSSNGGIESSENEMIQNVFELNDIAVKDICTHRKNIEWLSEKSSLKEWQEQIQSSHHSFYPIYDEEEDEIIGILDVKKYFCTEHSTKEAIWKNAVRKPYFVPSISKSDDVLGDMRRRGDYFACILDEYGTFIGIVTLRDIMEIIVGDLNESGQTRKEEIVEIENGKWLIQGTALLTEVERKLKVNLRKDESGIFSGYLIHALGRIPKDGEEIDMEIDAMKIHINMIQNHVVESAVVFISKR